ncbi:uncharacterized protein YndB with AHSA1/START domain [Marmoricola sp. URHA0025 HA25]
MHPVGFDVPVEVAFDYLVDPRNRPEWQSSLRAVERVDGRPRVGQTWLDSTRVGVRAAMETTALERPLTWTERGRWRGIEATLTLRFRPAAQGCDVSARFVVTGHGLARPLGPVLGPAARLAVPRDLRRASRILSERTG